MITTPSTDHHQILWYLEFDGLVNKLGAGAGVWIHNTQNDHAEGHAYRLNFRCTNNMAEYEALLLGFKLIRHLGATKSFNSRRFRSDYTTNEGKFCHK